MNIGLRFNTGSDEQQILINAADPHLHPGASVHGLHLTVRVVQHELPGAFLFLQGEANAEIGGTRPRRWLASWAGTEPILLRPLNIESSGQIVIPLTDSQIWQIEDARNGNDFTIELRISASLVLQGKTCPMPNQVQYQVRIDRELWLRQLAGVGSSASFTVAVPTAGDADGSGMSSVVRFLRDAESAYRDSRDRDAAVALRRAVDRFREIQSIMPEKSFKDVALTRRDGDQRWAAAFQAVLGVLNAAPHGDEVTEKIEFNRRDSQALIAMVFGLLGRQWG